MNAEHTQVQQAIADSIRQNMTVELTSTVDTQEWVNLAEALSAECDDWSEENARRVGAIREYWGTDDDGDEWKVRLIGQ